MFDFILNSKTPNFRTSVIIPINFMIWLKKRSVVRGCLKHHVRFQKGKITITFIFEIEFYFSYVFLF